jgi:hypothetical protein
MTAWQFWALFTLSALNLMTLGSLLNAVKSLWTKLHEIQQVLANLRRE